MFGTVQQDLETCNLVAPFAFSFVANLLLIMAAIEASSQNRDNQTNLQIPNPTDAPAPSNSQDVAETITLDSDIHLAGDNNNDNGINSNESATNVNIDENCANVDNSRGDDVNDENDENKKDEEKTDIDATQTDSTVTHIENAEIEADSTLTQPNPIPKESATFQVFKDVKLIAKSMVGSINESEDDPSVSGLFYLSLYLSLVKTFF